MARKESFLVRVLHNWPVSKGRSSGFMLVCLCGNCSDCSFNFCDTKSVEWCNTCSANSLLLSCSFNNSLFQLNSVHRSWNHSSTSHFGTFSSWASSYFPQFWGVKPEVLLNMQNLPSSQSEPLLKLPKLRVSFWSSLSFREQLHRQKKLSIFSAFHCRGSLFDLQWGCKSHCIFCKYKWIRNKFNGSYNHLWNSCRNYRSPHAWLFDFSFIPGSDWQNNQITTEKDRQQRVRTRKSVVQCRFSTFQPLPRYHCNVKSEYSSRIINFTLIKITEKN